MKALYLGIYVHIVPALGGSSSVSPVAPVLSSALSFPASKTAICSFIGNCFLFTKLDTREWVRENGTGEGRDGCGRREWVKEERQGEEGMGKG